MALAAEVGPGGRVFSTEMVLGVTEQKTHLIQERLYWDALTWTLRESENTWLHAGIREPARVGTAATVRKSWRVFR